MIDKNKIKTVFVDLDDTLWWFTENSKVSLRYVYDAYNIADTVDYERFKTVYVAKNKELWELYHYGKIEKDFLVTERFRYTLEQIGHKGDIDALGRELNDAYLNYLADLKLMHPGAKELLEYLVDRYDVNILSNGFKSVQQRKLKAGGIDQFIHKLILSDDCGVTKPLPGIFEYALEQCGADAESSVMIGDNYDADVCGAHNMGWKTIFYDWRGTELNDKSAADAVVKTLVEVEKYL